MDNPAHVRIEYWSTRRAEWVVGHAGLTMPDPLVYLRKINARGVVTRLVDVETGEIAYGDGGDLL